MDELAHTNAPVCRHTKRYQDIEELLNAGIDVYTTVKAAYRTSVMLMVTEILSVSVIVFYICFLTKCKNKR